MNLGYSLDYKLHAIFLIGGQQNENWTNKTLILSLYKIYLCYLDGLPKMQTQNFTRPAYLMVYHFLVFNYCLQCWCASPNFFTPGRLPFSQSGICFISHDDSIENWHKNASKMEFFFKVKAGKNGACALLICPLN